MRMIKRARTTHRAWAIEKGQADKRHLLFAVGARYSTRRFARDALRDLKERGFTLNGRVVRVSVTVTTIGRG